MEFTDLFLRPPLAGQPISLLLTDVAESELPSILSQAVTFLTQRGPGNEILLAVPQFPQTRLPARARGQRIRFVIVPEGSEGSRLTALVSAARHPILAWFDPQGFPSADKLSEMVERLEHADLVVGRRRRNWLGWFAWPMNAALRGVLGLTVSDPTCPAKLFRRDSFQGTEWTGDGAFLHVEFHAKATYLVRLIDEVPWSGRVDSLGGVLVRHWAGIVQQILHPRFGSAKPYWECAGTGAPAAPATRGTPWRSLRPPFSIHPIHPRQVYPRQSLRADLSSWPTRCS